MTTSYVRSTVVLSLAGLMIFSAAGCEDSASKQRDDVRVQLAQIRSDLQKTLATGGDDYDASLNKIVTRLGSVSGGEPGQQAAKALLAADTLREIAAIHMSAAAGIEGRNSAELGVVNARIDAVLRLQSLASGLGSIDDSARRNELQTELQKSRDGVAALQAHIAKLESPINAHNAQNTQQKQEIERLRLQVGDLLKQAQDLGYSAGLATYKQATTIDRQADKIEYEVSNREIDLEHDLNPQHKMAQTQKAQLEGLAQAIETAQTELDAFSKAAAGDAQASRAIAADINKQINEGLAEVKSEADGPLAAAYESALSALDKAATNARTASGGGDGGASRMLGAGISESIARVHLSAARGVAAREMTLRRVKASNGAVDVAGVDAQIKDLGAAYQQHIDAAKTALDEAKQAADAISGNSNDVLAFRTSLDALIAAVSGKSAPADMSSSSTGESGTNAASPQLVAAPPAGTGAESPEALVAALQAVKTMQDAGNIFQLMLPPSDPQMQGVMGNLRGMFDGVAALDVALQSKFGKSVLDLKGAATGDMSMIADASLVTSDEATGSIKIIDTTGKTTTAPIVKVDERWFIGSTDDDTASFAALGMEAPGGGASTPEAAQMAKQMMVMMSGMLTAMGSAMSELAQSVDAGEYASFDEFQTKADEQMQEVMQNAMGMPGGLPAAGGDEPGK